MHRVVHPFDPGDQMTTFVVMGSCLTNLAATFLMSDFKWKRPNNAAVLRSDHFVDQFIDRKGRSVTYDEFRPLVKWPEGDEKDGEEWLNECFRDRVGHLGNIPLDQPGLFETLETSSVDLVLMDSLHDFNNNLLRYRSKPGEFAWSLPFALNRCANENELRPLFDYGPKLEVKDSINYWVRIIRFVQAKQPRAKIMFFCPHLCTSQDLPERHARLAAFHRMFAPLAPDLGITVVPPFELPYDLTRMPEDRDHFEWLVYRAMAGKIYLEYVLGTE
jgi:hypothetical protein